jgi:hypothetical protein
MHCFYVLYFLIEIEKLLQNSYYNLISEIHKEESLSAHLHNS